METVDLSHHILSRFNADLEGVRSAVLQMGGLVEQQLQNGVTALVKGDSRLGEEVARLDHKVNAHGSRDRRRLQPHPRDAQRRRPSDLRLIVAVIKTITDLERIGDEAEKLGAHRRAPRDARASDGPLPRDQAHRARWWQTWCTARSTRSRGSTPTRRSRSARQDRAGGRGVRGDPAPVHHVHDGRSAHDPPRARRPVGGARARAHRRSREEHLRVRDLHGARQGHPPPLARGRREAAGSGARAAPAAPADRG